MFRTFGLNCSDLPDICEKENVKSYPSFLIYPPLPTPVIPYEGEFDTKKATALMARFVDNKSTEININSHDEFVADRPDLPKALFFTENAKGVPLVIKSLSVKFDGKINIGVVRSSETGLVKKHGIKKFPALIVFPVGEKKIKTFKEEFKYGPIFDWLNVFSETFMKVGEDKINTATEQKKAKPWLKEMMPELTAESGDDVCFHQDGIVCFIIFAKENPKHLHNTIKELQNYLSPKIDRGINYKFGWIDTGKQKEFTQAVGIDGDRLRFGLVNPGKRKRYFIAEEGTEPELQSLS